MLSIETVYDFEYNIECALRSLFEALAPVEISQDEVVHLAPCFSIKYTHIGPLPGDRAIQFPDGTWRNDSYYGNIAIAVVTNRLLTQEDIPPQPSEFAAFAIQLSTHRDLRRKARTKLTPIYYGNGQACTGAIAEALSGVYEVFDTIELDSAPGVAPDDTEDTTTLNYQIKFRIRTEIITP